MAICSWLTAAASAVSGFPYPHSAAADYPATAVSRLPAADLVAVASEADLEVVFAAANSADSTAVHRYLAVAGCPAVAESRSARAGPPAAFVAESVAAWVDSTAVHQRLAVVGFPAAVE